MFGVSYATAAPDYTKLQHVTFATVTPEEKAKTRTSWGWQEVAGTVLVLACILTAYLYFTG
jgi:SSS family solute:Na+ symporter